MLCAIAIIDSTATARLAKWTRVAEHFGIAPQSVHGHITLAAYVGDDEESFISSCKAILSNYGKFYVCYDRVEAWSCRSGTKSLIAAVPRKEHAIAAIQKEIAKNWSPYLNEWTQTDVWCPHTSLLYVQGADLSAAAEAMQEEFEPFAAEINRVEFSRVYENGYAIIDCAALK